MGWQYQGKRIVAAAFRGAYLARRAQARWLSRPQRPTADWAAQGPYAAAGPSGSPRRNILFITVDQQRYDALGVNGGQVARTPTLDSLAAALLHGVGRLVGGGVEVGVLTGTILKMERFAVRTPVS